MDWSSHLYVVLRSHFSPFCTLYTCELHLSERYGAVSTTSMAFAPVVWVHSQQLPLPQRHFQNLSCRKFDHWMLGGPVAEMSPLAGIRNLPHRQSCLCSRRSLPHYRCPKSVQLSYFGTAFAYQRADTCYTVLHSQHSL